MVAYPRSSDSSWMLHSFPVPWLLVAAVIGCSRPYEDKFSRARPPVFKTTGIVTWNGSPASGALVTLHSKAHNLAASGRADADGAFTLTTWRLGDGAVAGEHAVSIESIVITGYTVDGLPIEVNDMPPKYQNPETSGLTAVISDAGMNHLAFEVSGPKRVSRKPSNPSSP
jgi:hypothetical protein